MNALDIKKGRLKLGLTQGELAELVGVSENTIYNYERGTKIPSSKTTILRMVLFPKKENNISNEDEEPYKIPSQPEIKAHQNTLLESVNIFIKNLEAIKKPDLTDLQQLKEAIKLKADIQKELELL